MIKNKKIFLLMLFILISFGLFGISNKVYSDEQEIVTVTDFNNGTVELSSIASNVGGSYGVKETLEDTVLEYGLKYRHDFGYSMGEAGYTTGYAAGGAAYATSGTFKTGVYYPQNVNVFEIPQDSGIEVVPWVKFNGGVWALNNVINMAKDYEESHPGYKVIGAINGDYFDINSEKNYPKTSTGGTVSQGDNFKVSSSWLSIGFKDGTLKGNIKCATSEHPFVDVLDSKNEVIYHGDVNKINEDPEGNETSVFVTFYDAGHNPVKFDVNDAYILKAEKLAPFDSSSIYLLGNYDKKGNDTLDSTKFAIKTNDEQLQGYIEAGYKIRIQHTYVGELEDYDSVVGYPGNLMVDGEVQPYDNYRHPRTMIGKKADGTIVMAVVDGRQYTKGYYGATGYEEAAIMKYYGCVDAYNLDGGGSSTIVIIRDGGLKIMNSPSDGNPRSDGNCLLLVARVPEMNVEVTEKTTSTIEIKVDVIELLDEYKDLYISIGDEKKKIESGKTYKFEKLSSNTKYIYQVLAKIGEEYLKIPYTDAVTTSKVKFAFDIANVEIVNKNGKDYYELTVKYKDEDYSIISYAFSIKDKKYYEKDSVISIPVDAGSPLVFDNHFTITFDLNDDSGRHIEPVNISNAKTNSPNVIVATCVDEFNSWIDKLID